MTAKFSLDLPFFFDVHLYQRADKLYFINAKAGTWAALPKFYAKSLLDERRAEFHSETYLKAYKALATSNIIRDANLNTRIEPLMVKPLLVKFQTTGKCNLKCKYCFNNLDIRDKTMSRETMRQAVEYVFTNPYAIKGGVIFVIYGGEPLMDRELLFDTIRCIRRKGDASYVGIITNATLLTEDDVRFFKANDIHTIVSFDGLPEFQARNRLRTAEVSRAEKVLANLTQLSDLDYMDHNCVLCTVTKEMSSRLLEITLFMQAQGIRSIEFLPLRMLGTAKGQDQMSTNARAFITSLQQIVEAIEDGRVQTIRVRSLLRLLLPLVTSQTVKGEIGCHRCSAGRNSIAINYDGSIIGCDMIPEDISPKIGDVWNGITALDKLDKLIAPFASEQCKKCLWLKFCRGGCSGASAGDNGDINTRHRFTCAVNKAMYPFLLEKLATDRGRLREYFRQSSTVTDTIQRGGADGN